MGDTPRGLAEDPQLVYRLGLTPSGNLPDRGSAKGYA